MQMSLNTNNINFKGAAITPTYGNEFSSTIFWQASQLLYNKDIKLDSLQGSESRKLNLWDADQKLFGTFFDKHELQIPITNAEMGYTDTVSASDLSRQSCRLRKFAIALTQVLEIPKVLTQEALAAFIADKTNLTKNVLTTDILKKALAKVVKK